jgi:putative heme-binding domain-containing protein
LCLVFLGAGYLLALEDPHEKKPGDKNLALKTPEDVAAGGKLFASACAGCHGRHGEGGRGPKLSEGGLILGAEDQRLYSSIKNGVKGTTMPPFDLPDQQIRQLLGFVRSFSAPAAETQVPGNVESGASLFYGKAGCSGCHAIHGHGGFLGPDLTNSGGEHSALQLREAVTNPKLLSTGDYRAVRLVLKSGKTLEGVLRGATNYAFALQTADGNIHSLSAAELRQITYHEGPSMPRDYTKRLTAAEIDDVLAFLARQTVRPRASD